MSFNYSFDPAALIEYHDAITWYGERSMDTVEHFIKAVEEKIKKICLTPKLYRNSYKSFREISLSRFPYSIVYLADEITKTIIITSIYHHSRNPVRKYKKK